LVRVDAIRLVVAGESAEATADWSALIAKHTPRVVVALLAIGLPLDRARDLAQETWLKLMTRHRDGRLNRLDLPGLAIRQACFLALDARRREQREAVEPREEQRLPDLETQFLTGERARKVREVLSRCPPAARAVFEQLQAAPDASHAELAQAVGLSVERVRHILCETRKTLRLELAKEEP
jgi:RNA polymerase sigma-70 factor (ECF subfamily)